MSNLTSPRPQRIPEREGSFLAMWRDLRTCPVVWVPVGQARGEGRGIRGPGALELVDGVVLPTPDGRSVSVVYTDWRMFRPSTVFAEVPTVELLRRWLASSRVDGIAFNGPLDDTTWAGDDSSNGPRALTRETGFSCTVFKPVLSRLIGFLESPDPDASSGFRHVELAEEALREDRHLVALHHAVSGREAENLNSEEVARGIYMEAKILSDLGYPGESESVLSLLSKETADLWSDLARCRLRTDPDGNRTLLEAAESRVMDSGVATFAWAEFGWAHFRDGRIRASLRAFEECLARDPEWTEAWWGRGLALRNLETPEPSREDLGEALDSFERVAGQGGDRSREAFSQASSVYLEVGMWSEAEQAALTALSGGLDSPVARRNLILALHGQGKVSQARQFYSETERGRGIG